MSEIDLQKIAKTIVEDHGARMRRSHKQEFRTFISDIAEHMGYDSKIENGFMAKNVVIGNPSEAEVVLTAHYDTPPNMPMHFLMKQIKTFGIGVPCVMGAGMLVTDYAIKSHNTQLLNLTLNLAEQSSNILMPAIAIGSAGLIAYSMGVMGGENKYNYDDNSSGIISVLALMNYYKNLPESERNKVAFVLFDNEEKGLFGSLTYSAKHKRQSKKEGGKQVSDQRFYNFDCVGKGSRINLIYTKSTKKELVDEVSKAFSKIDGFSVNPRKSSINTMSDHLSFSKSKGSMTILCDEKDLPVTSHIHSSRDTEINLETISLIASATAENLNELLDFNRPELAKYLNAENLNMSGKLIAPLASENAIKIREQAIKNYKKSQKQQKHKNTQPEMDEHEIEA